MAVAPQASAAKTAAGFFGGTGSAAGQFSSSSSPNGIAVNLTGAGGATPGDVYVVDSGNHRIQQFSSTGAFVRAFGASVGGAGINECTVTCFAGTASSAAGGMSLPQGVAIDQSTGQVLVTDQENRRIDVFSATGVFEGAFGWGVDTGATAFEFCTTASTCQAPAPAGAKAGQFGAAIGHPAVNPTNGNLLVANPTSRRVDEFDVTGSPAIGAVFIRAYGFNVVAAGPDNTGTAFEVCNVAANPTDVCQAGTAGKAGGQFASNSPTRIAIDSSGNAYALDTNNSRIQKFSSVASLVGAFEPAAFVGAPAPVDIGVDPLTDRVLVVRPCSATACPTAKVASERRILEFDGPGFLLDTHAVESGITGTLGIAAGLSSRIYLSAPLAGVNRGVVIFDSSPPLPPPAATIEAVTTFGATTATFTGQVNPTGFSTGYHFEYSVDGVNWVKVPATDMNVGGGVAAVPATANATGLSPSTLYRVRLVATKLFGGAAATSAETTFTTQASAPSILSTSFSETASKSVRLTAEINPNSQATTYQFEYGTSDCTPNPCAGGSLLAGIAGSGSVTVIVSAWLKGLDPDTAYHFRVVAANPTGTAASADRAFHTFPTPSFADGPFPGQGFLSDGRVWEMVSPPAKNGNDVLIDTARVRAAESEGDLPMAAMFSSRGAFADVAGGGNAIDYISQRTAEPGTQGWSTHAVTPSQEPLGGLNATSGVEGLYRGEYATDLSRAVFRSYTPLPGTPVADAPARNLYLRTDLRRPGAGTYRLLSGCSFACPTAANGAAVRLAGSTSDFDSVLFATTRRLTEDSPASTSAKLYKSVDGVLQNVGYVPASPSTSCTGVEPSCLIAPRAIPGMNSGALLSGSSYAPHVVSSDGTRSFFTVASSDVESSGNLFMRDDQGTIDPADDTTAQINASERTSADSDQVATYWDAMPSGSRAYFTTKRALTNDAPVGGTDKLYMWDRVPDEEGNHLTYLSADHEPADALGAVRGILGISDRGDYVYFLQAGQIVSGAPALNAEVGIYRWREGDGVSYLGKVTDSVDVSDDLSGAPSTTLAPREQVGARVTKDGRYLLISLRQPPLPGGYDHGSCPEDGGTTIGGKQGCRELYVYDAASDDAPLCVSCSPEGLAGSAPAFYSVRFSTANTVTTEYLNRAITEDGRFAFFSTASRLVENDVNGGVDAYVYDTSTRKPRLLSSGESNYPAYFLDASADGADAFFATRQQLSRWDVDSNFDIYDARVGGGLSEPSLPPSGCVDVCQPPPAQLVDPVPASATGSKEVFRRVRPTQCRLRRRAGRTRGRNRCLKQQKGGARRREGK